MQKSDKETLSLTFDKQEWQIALNQIDKWAKTLGSTQEKNYIVNNNSALIQWGHTFVFAAGATPTVKESSRYFEPKWNIKVNLDRNEGFYVKNHVSHTSLTFICFSSVTIKINNFKKAFELLSCFTQNIICFVISREKSNSFISDRSTKMLCYNFNTHNYTKKTSLLFH